MSLKFTILLPVHRSADLMRYAIKSVLWQTTMDFELFVVCDGSPPDTIDCANAFAQQDARVHVFPYIKGLRHGEAYRHEVLGQAKGRYIAHICDDDLWFPNHLEEMTKLLQHADFGNVIHCYVDPDRDDCINSLPGDLSDPAVVERMMMTAFNFFGPTVAGYTMAAYRQLSQGWAPAPEGVWTDLHMWRKFLAVEALTCETRMSVTSCHFSTLLRPHFSPADRKAEMMKWFQKIQSPEERDSIIQQVFKRMNDDAYAWRHHHYRLTDELKGFKQSLSWRMTRPLRYFKARFLMGRGAV